ncbi:MAG: T9SS type A sorting domain-containing protein [Bacteroidetes bacterium]|nr:T9SS type A sorting domain-containing protein [Bacteroidota bacterium]
MKKISSIIVVLLIISFSAIGQEYIRNVGSINNNITRTDITTQVKIIGNPARGFVLVQISNPNPIQLEMCVYNEAGTKVNTMIYNHPGGFSTMSINLSNDSNGLYFLTVTSLSGNKTIQFSVVQ